MVVVYCSMTYGYSKDLRKKALEYFDRGHSRSEVCDVFGIHRHTFASWLRIRSSGEDLSPRVNMSGKRPHKIDSERLAAYVETHPNAYLHEIAAVFSVSDVGIMKALRRLGITRKKKPASIRRGMN